MSFFECNDQQCGDYMEVDGLRVLMERHGNRIFHDGVFVGVHVPVFVDGTFVKHKNLWLNPYHCNLLHDTLVQDENDDGTISVNGWDETPTMRWCSDTQTAIPLHTDVTRHFTRTMSDSDVKQLIKRYEGLREREEMRAWRERRDRIIEQEQDRIQEQARRLEHELMKRDMFPWRYR